MSKSELLAVLGNIARGGEFDMVTAIRLLAAAVVLLLEIAPIEETPAETPVSE